jgi:hypothetical protein
MPSPRSHPPDRSDSSSAGLARSEAYEAVTTLLTKYLEYDGVQLVAGINSIKATMRSEVASRALMSPKVSIDEMA